MVTHATPTHTPAPETSTPVPPTASPTPVPPTPTAPRLTASTAATTVPTVSLEEVTVTSDIEEGKALVATAGCTACHGANVESAENLGPALAGHSQEAVFKQVRSPRKASLPTVQMPAYGPEQLSDEQLDEIVVFIQSLGPPMGAGAFAGSMPEAAHLRLAVAALESGDTADVRAHLQDLISTGEGETQERAQEILDLLDDGDRDEAEHELETMASQAPGADLTTVQLHFVLALNALARQEDVDAAVHLENASSVAPEDEKERIEELLTDLRAGKARDVERELGEKTGQPRE